MHRADPAQPNGDDAARDERNGVDGHRAIRDYPFDVRVVAKLVDLDRREARGEALDGAAIALRCGEPQLALTLARLPGRILHGVLVDDDLRRCRRMRGRRRWGGAECQESERSKSRPGQGHLNQSKTGGTTTGGFRSAVVRSAPVAAAKHELLGQRGTW